MRTIILVTMKLKRRSLLLIVLGSMLTLPMSAKTNERDKHDETVKKTRQIKRSFAATSNTSVELVNKYGNIHINTWEKDSIRLEIDVTAIGKKANDVDGLMEFVEFDIMGSSSYVIAKSIFGKKVSPITKNFVQMKSAFKKNFKLEVEYTLYMPQGCDISLKNKFGDIYLPDVTGDLDVDLSHGDLRAKEVGKVKLLKVQYGKVNIDKIAQGNLQLGFAELDVESTGELLIKSRSSEYHIASATMLNLESKHDKFYIESVERVVGEVVFSDLNIKKLKYILDVTTKYGDVNVSNINSSFSNISLTGSFTDYSLLFDKGTNFDFDVTMDAGKSFSYPSSTSITSDQTIEKKRMVNGSFGTQNSGRNVRINAKSSYIKMN